jgi:hypothetical protein
VKAVDAGKNTLTIASANGETTYAVAKDAEIWIDARPGTLAELRPGPQVYATLTVNQMTVQRLDALGRHFPYVTVTAVDPEKRTITFHENKAPPELAGKSFPVAKNPASRSTAIRASWPGCRRDRSSARTCAWTRRRFAPFTRGARCLKGFIRPS